MDNRNTRLSQVIKDLGLTQKQLAEELGTSQSAISAIATGVRPMTEGFACRIESIYGVRTSWLLTGEGEKMKKNNILPEISYTEGVPYYDEDFLLGFEELVASGNENPEYLIKMPGYEKATLWCNASGHSMEPEINNGDIIALQRIDDFSFLPFGDVYGFITTNGLRTIKRLGRSQREGYYRLIPTNKEYDEQEIPISKIALVYRVMGTMKAF